MATTEAARELLAWYAERRRDLPWRRTRDPYRILVSEVMLQQTPVDRVLPFYAAFLARFPDEQTLAAAAIEDVQRVWKGLGYPSRAERLQRSCQIICQTGDGRWPSEPAQLQALPGIGPYTAAALSCFAFARPVPLVDTNVARVYARRDGLVVPLKPTVIWRHAADQLAPEDPIAYNNALMELGALVCTARAPDCPACPWHARCRREGEVDYLQISANPLKVASARKTYGDPAPARKLPRQHIVLALIHHDGRYLVARRPRDRHAGGVWELPGGKRARGEDDRIALARELDEELGLELMAARPFVRFHYAYPDRALQFHVYRCRVFHPERAQARAADGLRWVTPAAFLRLTFPPANQPIRERLRDYHRLHRP